MPKYIKRTGTPGNYKYEYAEDQKPKQTPASTMSDASKFTALRNIQGVELSRTFSGKGNKIVDTELKLKGELLAAKTQVGNQEPQFMFYPAGEKLAPAKDKQSDQAPTQDQLSAAAKKHADMMNLGNKLAADRNSTYEQREYARTRALQYKAEHGHLIGLKFGLEKDTARADKHLKYAKDNKEAAEKYKAVADKLAAKVGPEFVAELENKLVKSEATQILLEALEKAKYIKRTGVPGNYKYEYAKEEEGTSISAANDEKRMPGITKDREKRAMLDILGTWGREVAVALRNAKMDRAKAESKGKDSKEYKIADARIDYFDALDRHIAAKIATDYHDGPKDAFYKEKIEEVKKYKDKADELKTKIEGMGGTVKLAKSRSEAASVLMEALEKSAYGGLPAHEPELDQEASNITGRSAMGADLDGKGAAKKPTAIADTAHMTHTPGVEDMLGPEKPTKKQLEDCDPEPLKGVQWIQKSYAATSYSQQELHRQVEAARWAKIRSLQKSEAIPLTGTQVDPQPEPMRKSIATTQREGALVQCTNATDEYVAEYMEKSDQGFGFFERPTTAHPQATSVLRKSCQRCTHEFSAMYSSCPTCGA